MTNVLNPPVQDLAPHVDVAVPPVKTPDVNRYIEPVATEGVSPVVESTTSVVAERKYPEPITDVRLARMVLLAAQMKGEMKQKKRLAANKSRRSTFDGSSRLV